MIWLMAYLVRAASSGAIASFTISTRSSPPVCTSPSMSACSNGSAAVEEALRLKPDICLLDLEMPGLDGVEVAERLQAMGEKMTRDDFMALVLEYAGDDERLQAVAGLMRPALDYTFFQELTRRIEKASGAERERLEHLRARLAELTAAIDEQTQAVLKRAVETLRIISSSEDVDAAISARLDQLDDTFLAVLQANIQAAEQAGDTRSVERFQLVLERVMAAMRESAPPQIRLINDLVNADTDEEARQLLAEHAPTFGPELVEIMDAIQADLDEHNQPGSARRMRELREMAAQLVNSGR